jgi:hypothetical protein
MSRNNNCINIPSSQTFRSYLFYVLWLVSHVYTHVQPLALLDDEFMQVRHAAAATRIASDSMIGEGLSAMNISE